jgi:hypothetical protein
MDHPTNHPTSHTIHLPLFKGGPRGITLLVFLLLTTSLYADVTNEIHTVLPKDAIPAIFAPQFVNAEDADVDKNTPMIGVSLNGEHHAYSMYLLNRHEIVNDVVGGEPIASTW